MSKRISDLLNNLSKPTEDFTASEGEDNEGERSHDEIIEYAPKPKVRKQKVRKQKIVLEEDEPENEPKSEPKSEPLLIDNVSSDAEDESSEEEIKQEKPKKVKKPSQLKKYQQDKEVIKSSLVQIKNLIREFKQNILKLVKTYKNEELFEDDYEDIIEHHNHYKTQLLQNLYHLEDDLNSNDVKLPKSIYTSLDKAFDTCKARVNKLLEH